MTEIVALVVVPLTLELLKSMRLCWTPAMLDEAAKLWPSPTPGWAWFLGEHFAGMKRSEQQQRLATAFALMQRESFPIPGAKTRGEAFFWFKRASDAQYAAAAAALGEWLDALDQSTGDALAALLSANPGG